MTRSPNEDGLPAAEFERDAGSGGQGESFPSSARPNTPAGRGTSEFLYVASTFILAALMLLLIGAWAAGRIGPALGSAGLLLAASGLLALLAAYARSRMRRLSPPHAAQLGPVLRRLGTIAGLAYLGLAVALWLPPLPALSLAAGLMLLLALGCLAVLGIPRGHPERRGAVPAAAFIFALALCVAVVAGNLWLSAYSRTRAERLERQAQAEELGARRAAVRLHPKDAEAWYYLGRAYFEQWKFGQAAQAYEESIRLAPDRPEAFEGVAEAYLCAGRHEEAAKAAREALSLDPDDAWAYLVLGASYGNLGRRQEALRAFKRAAELKPDDADLHYEIAWACGYLEWWPESARACERAVKLRPDFPAARYSLGVAYVRLGRTDRALQQCALLKRLNSELAKKLSAAIRREGSVSPSENRRRERSLKD
jgi:tetratricopeptide (TPR) repeat protein